MAGSLVPTEKSSTPAPVDPVKVRVAELIAEGFTTAQIAQKLAPKDKKKRAAWRAKLRRWAMHDEAYQQQLVLAGRAKALQAAVGVIPAVEKRGRRGRTDAAKYLAEVSGFHNPKVKHEHSGGLELKIVNAPRPKKVETVDSTAEVTDAEVVEDGPGIE